MKYRIVVQKQRPQDDENQMFRGRAFDEGYDNVFTAEIGADEAIELGQHLWDISKRNKV